MMILLPFDAHNHVHMGSSEPQQALMPSLPTRGKAMEQISAKTDGCASPAVSADRLSSALYGMAIMSTTLEDFSIVSKLAHQLPAQFSAGSDNVMIVPCYGVHPWFLHELTHDDWSEEAPILNLTEHHEIKTSVPRWVNELTDRLMLEPNSVVGEIGLDGFHFDPVTKHLTTTIEQQILAFRYQMEIAATLNRPVSIHAVQCWGPLLEVLTTLRKQSLLPPRMYFHAFGGKEGTADQLLALCEDRPTKHHHLCDVAPSSMIRAYFGFAPVVNFRSPKTAAVVRKIGINRLVLETDHEDAALVLASIHESIRFLACALNIDSQTLIQQTTENAVRLYSIQ